MAGDNLDTSPGPGLLGARRLSPPPWGSPPHASQGPEDTELGEESIVIEAALCQKRALLGVGGRGQRESALALPLGQGKRHTSSFYR